MPKTMQSSLRKSLSHCSRTSIAELTFSVSMVEDHFQEGSYGQGLSEMVPIFLTTILEFLACRLLELASSEVQCPGTHRFITLELLVVTVHDTRLAELFQFTTISPAHSSLCSPHPH
nr:histone H2A.1-like [Meriones unguiculatus]